MIEYLGGLSKYLGLPVNSASHGHVIDYMIGWVHWLMLFLFVGWGIYLIITIIKFSEKNNPKADYNGLQSHHSQYAEYGVIIFEAFLLIGLSLPLWAQLKTQLPNDNEVHHVRVIAQQFAWNIHYPGDDGKFGRTDIKLVDEESNPIGLDRSSPFGADDIVSINQMYLPVNKQVMVHLSSKDVIHSFGVPELRVKQDAIPGMSIPIFFTPTMTSEDYLNKIKDTERYNPVGNYGFDEETWSNLSEKLKNQYRGYQIACAQLCGNSHYKMRGFVNIQTEAEYASWLAQEAEYLEEEDDDDDW